MQKELMSVEEFLAVYSISRTIYFEQVKKNLLKQTKLGRRTYIKRIDAEAWLAKIEPMMAARTVRMTYRLSNVAVISQASSSSP